VSASVRDGRSKDEGGPYDTEAEAIERCVNLQRFGICTGYRNNGGRWELLHDVRGTTTDIKHERRAT
jgi:hypothetical protein